MAGEEKEEKEETLIDKEQDRTIAELKMQIESLKKFQIETSEKRRGWVRAGLVGWFCALITYIVLFYTGTEDGKIKPDIIWSFLTGILVTKMIDHYINPGTKTDRVL